MRRVRPCRCGHRCSPRAEGAARALRMLITRCTSSRASRGSWTYRRGTSRGNPPRVSSPVPMSFTRSVRLVSSSSSSFSIPRAMQASRCASRSRGPFASSLARSATGLSATRSLTCSCGRLVPTGCALSWPWSPDRSWVRAGGYTRGSRIVLQAGGHRLEASAPAPFRGPLDVVVRIFAEQWVTFPRYVVTGGFFRAFRAAEGSSATGARVAPAHEART
jgi:hypothetical protein